MFLSGQGWTVVAGVLSPTEVSTCLDLTWAWLESLGSGIERSDPTSWTDHNWPGEFQSGITVQSGSNQQPSLWYIRGHPGVQQVFATIWAVQPSDLITSMDGMLIWRHKTSDSHSKIWYFCLDINIIVRLQPPLSAVSISTWIRIRLRREAVTASRE